MKKLLLIFTIILVSVSILPAQNVHNQYMGFGIGGFGLVGDNTENYDLGYAVNAVYDIKLANNLGLEISPMFGYIYGENEMAFWGVYVDNYLYGATVTPKLLLPVGSNGFRFVLGPKLAYAYVDTKVEFWYLDPFSGYEDTINKSQGQGMFSIGALAGLEFPLNDRIMLGFNATYDNFDFNKNFEEMEWDTQGYYDGDVNTDRIGINLTLKFAL